MVCSACSDILRHPCPNVLSSVADGYEIRCIMLSIRMKNLK